MGCCLDAQSLEHLRVWLDRLMAKPGCIFQPSLHVGVQHDDLAEAMPT